MTISSNSPAPVYGTEVQLPEVIQSSATQPENSSPGKQPLKIDPTGKFIDGEVIVRYKPEVISNNLSYQAASTAANQKINPKKIEEIGSKSMPGVQYVNLPENISVNEAVDIYLYDSNVSWAQPNYIYYPARVSNDPMFNEQWAVSKYRSKC
jgi:hypothetical protein